MATIIYHNVGVKAMAACVPSAVAYNKDLACLMSQEEVKGMAVDLASKEIRVNALLPGMIETPLIHCGDITEEQLKEDKKLYPLRRYGKPEEIAYAAIYLLSNASSFTTGANLVIDGGFTLL